MASLANCGNMLMTAHYDIRGGIERIDYKFEDGPYVAISGCFYPEMAACPPKIGDKLELGPYKFRVLEIDILSDTVMAVQEKWPLWWIAVAWHRVNKLIDIFYRRMIVTLAVWRLADYHEATVPYIGDIHIVQRIKRLFNGKRISNRS